MSMRSATALLLGLFIACGGCESSDKDRDADKDRAARRGESRSGREASGRKESSRHQALAVERHDAHAGDPDKHFMAMAAQDGVAEIELGRTVAGRSTNDRVKQLARRIIDDHTRANSELKNLAQQKGVSLPTQMHEGQRMMLEHFEALSGAELDKEYAAHMVAGHAKMVQMFQDKSKTAQDADLKAWTAKTLPTLNEHYRMAREVNDSLAGGRAASQREPATRQ